MLFDSLVHVTPDGRWFDTQFDASESRLLRELDEAQIDRAIVVPIADYISNDFVLEVCSRHPGRLIPACSINPGSYPDPESAAAQFDKLLDSGPFRALKLHPRLNRYDVLDPRVFAIMDRIRQSNRPPVVLIDTLLYHHDGQMRFPLVHSLWHIVTTFPEVKFVLLHAGGANLLPLMDAVRSSHNVFLDLSFTIHRYQGSSLELDMAYLLRTFDRRTVFGSDFPEVPIQQAFAMLRELGRELPTEKLQNVLGNNLSNLFREDP
ncbi:amidohydrolase family protein [Bremerella sp. JC770]|uniref:amidohydrolase family protein n=1 Tax=Bremerella sp. JC770 TaxID=3232137 RepID=UPI003457C9EF